MIHLLMAVCLCGVQPAEALSEQVRPLLRQLDAPEAQTRDQAEQALIELGPDVLSHLPQVNDRTAAEMKVRLERIASTLEKALAESVALPTQVKLSGEMSVTDALDAIQQQTGNRIVGGRQVDQLVMMDENNADFWPALDRLLDRANLAINEYGGNDKALTLQPRPMGQSGRFGYASYQGPFRIEATRLQAVRDLRNPQVQGLRIHVEVSWEPRVAPIAIGFPFDKIEAVDNEGQALAIENPDRKPNFPVQTGISMVDVDLPFPLPNRELNQLKSVSGVCQVLMPGRVETFEFPPLGGAEETQLRKAGVVVVLEGVRKNQDLYEVRMRVEFDDAGNALESHQGWVFNNEAYLTDSQGKRVDSLGHQTTRQELNAVGMAYLFDLEQPPQNYRFVYKTPALILKRSVPFKLMNLDLP